VSLSDVVTNFETGPLKLTDHPFDFAVAGDGFFRLQTEDGIRYTRDGRFHRDSDGRLVNVNGHLVLGSNGPLTLPDGLVTVSPTGDIFVDDNLVGQLSLAQFENPEDIIKADDTTFVGRNGVEPQLVAQADTQIYQGYLEDSNVDSAQAITEMMSVLRAYQANQRMVQYQDQINSKTVSELGSV